MVWKRDKKELELADGLILDLFWSTQNQISIMDEGKEVKIHPDLLKKDPSKFESQFGLILGLFLSLMRPSEVVQKCFRGAPLHKIQGDWDLT